MFNGCLMDEKKLNSAKKPIISERFCCCILNNKFYQSNFLNYFKYICIIDFRLIKDTK